jgi:hypothetical protein
MHEPPSGPKSEGPSERAFLAVAIVWIIAAVLEPGTLGSFWLLAAFLLALVMVLLVIKLREKSDLAQFADLTAAAWEAESKSLELMTPRFDVVLATDAEPTAIIQALHYFLQTSDWGAWNLESGNEARALYRRGVWTGTPPQAEPNFFSKYFKFHRTAGDHPAPGTPTTPSSAGSQWYQAWPLTLEISMRPTRGMATLKFCFQSPLGPNLTGLDSLSDAEPYRRNRCRLIDYYCRCMAAEMEDLAAHLTTALRLSQRPHIQRCE